MSKFMEERIAVKLEDIEQMILMADKVLDEVMMGDISKYDDNGVPLPDEKWIEQRKKDYAEGTGLLLYKLVREKHDSFDKVLAITAADLEKRLGHLKKRILGIFRSGVLEEWYRFYYYADESVPDEYLFTLFLMRVRDRMIVIGAERMHDESKERRQKRRTDDDLSDR